MTESLKKDIFHLCFVVQMCLFRFHKRRGEDQYLIIVLEVITLYSNHLAQIQSKIYLYVTDDKSEALRD